MWVIDTDRNIEVEQGMGGRRKNKYVFQITDLATATRFELAPFAVFSVPSVHVT